MVDPSHSMNYPRSAQESSSSGQMIDAFALLRTLRIHKWMLLGLALAGTALGFLVGFVLTPKYTAVAEILIEPEDSGLDENSDEAGDQLGDYTLETEVKFLTSKAYMQEIVRQIGVFEDTVEGGVVNAVLPAPSEPISYLSEASVRLDGDSEQAVGTTDLDPAVLEERVELFADNYDVQVAGGSRVIEISYTSDDPEEAAGVVNLAAKIHIDRKLGTKRETNVSNTNWIAERVEALREELNDAEREIEKFRASYSLKTDDFDARTEELSGFVLELIRLKAELSQEQTKLTSLQELRSKKQNLLNLPDIASSQTIGDLQIELREIQQRKAELANTYGENHPEMLAVSSEENTLSLRIEQEVDRIIQNLKDSVDIKTGQKAALEKEIAGSRAQQVLQSDFEVQLREKERNAEAIRELYEDFLQRSKQLNEERLAINSDIVQLSEAVPPALSDTPSPRLTALIGFCLAFLGGSVTAILRDQQDQRLRSERHISAHLGLKTIGVIPEIRDLRRRQAADGRLRALLPKKPAFLGRESEHRRLHEYMLEKPMSAYTDSIRNVFLALRSQVLAKGAKVVVTTSTLPNEGKTTFAVSLATLAADSGLQTLIMDLDLRHPSVREEMRAKSAPGLAEYVHGKREMRDALWTHPKISGLQAVMSTTPQANPMSILESDRFTALLNEARAFFDLVIIDSAPLFAVSEAKFVAALADAVIFVVRWGATDRETARGGLMKLEENNIDNVFGAVLSQVDLKTHHLHQYRDAGHYYKEYKDYYVN